MKYAMQKGDVFASTTFGASTKASLKICKAINRKSFDSAKKFIEDLIDEKKSLDGKFHTKSAKEILTLLTSVENNAKAKNVDPTGMEVFISTHKGPTYYRGRRKRSFGVRLKMTHVQVVLKKREK